MNLELGKPLAQSNTIEKYVLGARLKLLGDSQNAGILIKAIVIILLLNISLIYLNPFFYMISSMLKNATDSIDYTVGWIPRQFEWNNLVLAYKGLDYTKGFFNSIIISLFPALLQVVSCSIAGYAFARLSFPFKKLAFILLLLSFIVPAQVTLIPMFVLYKNLSILFTPLTFVLPALLGHGIKGALFVIIYRQFFLTQPVSLEEAAKIDGAGIIRRFFQIMFPLSRPAMIVVFLFSFVWHWNEAYLAGIMLGSKFRTLSTSLNSLLENVKQLSPEASELLSTSLVMAGSFLIVLPPLITYIFTQKWFTEGVERTGLVE